MMINKYSKKFSEFGRVAIAFMLIFSVVLSGIIPGIVGASGTQEWEKSAPTTISSVSTDSENDIVFHSDYNGNIVATYSSNKTEKWNKSIHSRTEDIVYNSSNNIIYSVGTDNVLNKINANTGGVIWSKSYSESLFSIAQSTKTGDVYITDSASVYAVSNTGTQLWSNSLSGDGYSATYSKDNNAVYVGKKGSGTSNSGGLEAFNPSDGASIWRNDLNGEAVNSLEALNGRIYAGIRDSSAESTLLKLDSTGTIVWENAGFDDIKTVSASEQSSRVYFGSVDLHTVNEDGSYAWNYSSGDTTKWYGIGVDDVGNNITVFGGERSTLRKITTDTEVSSKVSGAVVDSSNTGISDAEVSIYESGTLITSTMTDTNGDFSVDLEDGDYTLNITKSGYYPHESTFSVSGSAVDLGNIELQSIPKVNGIVINQSSENGVDNATVTILDNGSTVDQTQTNSNGEFGFELDNGTYTLNVSESTYYPYEATINVSGNTDLGDIELEPKEYDLTMRVSPYMNHSQTQEYVVRFNDDTITENVTVTSSNITLVTVNQTTQTLNSTDIVNDTGRVNITATYKVDGIIIRDSKNVTVAPMTIDYVEILPPLYGTLSIVTDETIQYLVLVVVAGIAITTITNAFGGIGLMIISLIIGWIMAYIPLGVLLSSLFGGIFIMMNTTMREYRR